MNKTAIKNFAIGARKKLIADVRYRAGLVGITEQEIKTALPQSNSTTEFYDIGTASPYAISGEAIRQRRNLAESIRLRAAADAEYAAAYRYIMEEVAYTWFNRLIAMRFMEVNEYLPGQVRVLSSESGKIEPDLVTDPFGSDLTFTAEEERAILRMKQDNQLDELFRLLFIKQCNALSAVLPALFEQTDDYTELLLNLSVVDQEGVVWKLTHDIPEDDFNVKKGGQVEIIGWLYQYYNTEPKAQVFARPSGQKIKKEEIPAATQLFTPDWIVRYMVENSLGRIVINNLNYDIWADEEKEKIGRLKAKWKYYLDEAPQDPEVDTELRIMEHNKYASGEVQPFIDTTLIDPCMGSGHILVYAFDVFMDIYKEQGWSQRDAAQRIVQYNLFGLDIDKRAYQLAYFAVMMKARQYDRRFLTRGIQPQVYYPGGDKELEEFGSLLTVEKWDKPETDQISLDDVADNYRRLLAQKYDVVCTNPPYMGDLNKTLLEFAKKYYPNSKHDLCSVFIERCLSMVCDNSYISMITQNAFMFLSRYEKLRKSLLQYSFVSMAHLGARAFDAIGGEVVQTTAFCIRKSSISNYSGAYERLVSYSTSSEKENEYLKHDKTFFCKNEVFWTIPKSPMTYWVTPKVLSMFKWDRLDAFADPRVGMFTTDNERYLREWWEPNIVDIGFNYADKETAYASETKWFPYNKGGGFRRWYGNIDLVVYWKHGGQEIKEMVLKKYPYLKGNYDFVLKTDNPYYRPGITWSGLTSGSNSFRICGQGFLFDTNKGAMIFEKTLDLKYLLGFLNTKVAQTAIDLLNSSISLQIGDVAAIPVYVDKDKYDCIVTLSKKCIDICKVDWDSFETSWDFTRHPLVRNAFTVAETYAAWEAECSDRFTQLKANEEELNRIFIDIYGLQNELTPDVEDKDVTVRRADLGRDIRSLLSYAVGCMFGRYSLDEPGLILAGYDKMEYETKILDGDSPELEKFAKKNPDGSVSYGSYYHWVSQERFKSFPIDIDNIIPITDEAYLEDDIVKRLCEWLRVVYGTNTLEENLDFIAKALGNKGATSREVIRNYFLKDFFADHCKIYQKRPIYWLFDSGKQNGFKALVYLHRYTPDTIGKLRVDYLHRLQRVYASEIERMQDMIDNSKNQREVAVSAKRKEKLQKQLKECREYDEKIAHLALARIELDLDDGVKVNYEKVQTAADGNKYPVLGKI